jgi:hypothetical protein
MSLMDWEKNVDPHYRKHWFRPPIVASEDAANVEKWVVYATGYVAAKELSVLPGASHRSKDAAAYGCILVQGHGRFGVHEAAAAVMLRFGGSSQDEYFVSEAAAREGILVENRSRTEPLVLLKHFGPNAGDPEHAASAELRGR